MTSADGAAAEPATIPDAQPVMRQIPLPPVSLFDTFDELFAFLQEFYRNNGAALVKKVPYNPHLCLLLLKRLFLPHR